MGRNALHVAALGGYGHTIRHLAPMMPSLINSTDNDGFNMLHIAAKKGHVDVVELVIDQLHFSPNGQVKVCVQYECAC